MLIIKTCTEVRPDEGRPSYQREQGMVLWKSCISLLVEEVLLGTTQIMLQCRDGKFVFTPWISTVLTSCGNRNTCGNRCLFTPVFTEGLFSLQEPQFAV